MNAFEKLVKIFGEFPGIGPRQAGRFVYFLLGKNPEYISTLIETLSKIKDETVRCSSCMRYFTKRNQNEMLCSICSDGSRDPSMLMLIAKDADLLSMEKAGIFNGYYFVIGGLVPVLEKNPEQRIRSNELLKCVKKYAEQGLKEIIVALSATNDGENTSLFLEKFLQNEIKNYNLKLTHLGRGLSTGSELEYADKDTIRAALENKK